MNGPACSFASPRCSSPLATLVMAIILTIILAAPLTAGTISAPGAEVAAIAVLPATSTTDFCSGIHDGTTVSETANVSSGGQLRLEPMLEDLFLASALDTMWNITLPPAGYEPVIEDGVIDLQERDDNFYARSALESHLTFTGGVVAEMRAAFFPGSAFVNIGFTSSTDSPDQWLYFSTRGSGSGEVPTIFTSMRTATSSTANVPTSVSLGEFHVFRIVWLGDTAEFWVDDVLVDTRTGVDIDMEQVFSLYKSDDSDSPFLIDWIRVTPYSATSGAYTSCVQDGGEPGRQWTRLTWEGAISAPTSAIFATRTGETAAPDGSWSDWADVAADAIASPSGRYLQYRASLATADSLASPVIDEVQLEFSFLDITPPMVLGTTPAAGVEGFPCQATVSAVFDEAIDPATVTGTSFTLTPFGGDPAPAAVSLDSTGTLAMLTPTAALACGVMYEARLTTAITDGDGNALAADHTWIFTTEPPDLTAPVILATVPAHGGAAVLPGRAISVQFDEAVDPATLTSSSFLVVPRDGAPVAASMSYDPTTRRATLTPLAELDLATAHEARITTAVTDVMGNPLSSDVVWEFTTRMDPVSVQVATSAADFGAGTLNNLAIAEQDSGSTAGQLRLAGVLSDRFDGSGLDPQWHTTRPDGYVPVVSDGLLDVQERDGDTYELSAIESYEDWGPGVVLEARAMFVPGSAYIDVGFDNNTLSNSQYAWFSTAGTGGINGNQTIYARVREYDHTTVAIETSAQFNQWHVFKIVWTHGRVDFYVDGVLEATHTDVLITTPMHAAFYKSNNSNTPFYIDWVRVTPYTPASGEYVSPVLDGGLEPTAWLDLQWSGATPAGTSATFATRTGDSAIPDGTWSDWSDVVGTDVTSPAARYAQYRSILTTSDPLASPVIDAVHMTHGAPGDLAGPVVVARDPEAGAVDVPRGAVVTATFDEPVDPYTIDGESFTLAPVGGEVVAAVVAYDAETRTLSLTPDAELAVNTVYEVILTATVRDVAGNALAEDQVWSFTTELDVVAAPDVPVMTALLPNYPNPFNPATTVRFDLARTQRVWIRLYGVDGRLVRTLVEGEMPAGRHTRIWDGRTDGGRTAPTGVYLLQLVTEDATQTRKISMLK